MPIIYFILSLLFAAFVAWFCFQAAAQDRNDDRLEKMRDKYSAVPLWLRMRDSADSDAAFEAPWIVAIDLPCERKKTRVRLATINFLKLRIHDTNTRTRTNRLTHAATGD